MIEYIVFVLLLFLGLFLIFNARRSFKKLTENNQQWQAVALNYVQYKDGKNPLLDLAIDEIKHMDNFADKTNKLNTTKESVYIARKYQNHYLETEKLVKKLQKIITFFARIEIVIGTLCCLFSFVFIYHLFSINTGWLGGISVIILVLSFGMIFYSLLGKQLWDIGALLGFNFRYTLLIDYFINNHNEPVKTIEEIFNRYLAQNRFLGILLNNSERDYDEAVSTRIIILSFIYIGLFLLSFVITVDKSFL